MRKDERRWKTRKIERQRENRETREKSETNEIGKDEKMITIYTDGSCWPNPGPGGWAAIISFSTGAPLEISGHEAQTTNNRMEMTAAIKALDELTPRSEVTVYTDSEYLRLGITQWLKRWKKRGWFTSKRNGYKSVKNADLWAELDELSELHSIEWKWVRGHNGNLMNERCDQLAEKARTGGAI